MHAFLRDDEGCRTPISKNLEDIARVYDTNPYTGPVPPIGGPFRQVEPSTIDPSVFEESEVEDRVLNWSSEEIQKVLPNGRKKILVGEGYGQVETSRRLPGLSQQSITFLQAEDYSSDSDQNDIASWKEGFDEDHSQLKRISTARVNNDNPYSVLSSIFKMLVAAVEKDNGNLKETEALLLNLVATVEGNVAKVAVKEEGQLALPNSKRKSVNNRR
jgi:hypothetical protein